MNTLAQDISLQSISNISEYTQSTDGLTQFERLNQSLDTRPHSDTVPSSHCLAVDSDVDNPFNGITQNYHFDSDEPYFSCENELGVPDVNLLWIEQGEITSEGDLSQDNKGHADRDEGEIHCELNPFADESGLQISSTPEDDQETLILNELVGLSKQFVDKFSGDVSLLDRDKALACSLLGHFDASWNSNQFFISIAKASLISDRETKHIVKTFFENARQIL